MKTFHLTIAKVGESLFNGEAESVTLPGKEGQFEVLSSHEPFVSELKEGQVWVTADGQEHHFDIQAGGIAEVSGNQATILL